MSLSQSFLPYSIIVWSYRSLFTLLHLRRFSRFLSFFCGYKIPFFVHFKKTFYRVYVYLDLASRAFVLHTCLELQLQVHNKGLLINGLIRSDI